MLIFLEGVDKAGKTFLGKKLCEMLNIPYFKAQKAPKNAVELRTKSFDVAKIEIEMLYELVKQTGISLVVDRFHISEWVYGTVYNRVIDSDFLWKLDEAFGLLGAVILFFDCDDEVLKSRWKDEMISFEDVKRIREAYSQALRKTRCKVIRFFCSEDTEENLNKLKLLVEELKDEAAL